MQTEIDCQSGQDGDREGGQHHPAPGISSDAKSQGREQRTDEPDQSHGTQPGQVIPAGVTQRNVQQPEGHAEDVPLLVHGGHDDERYQQEPCRGDTPRYVDSFELQFKDLRHIVTQTTRRGMAGGVYGGHEDLTSLWFTDPRSLS